MCMSCVMEWNFLEFYQYHIMLRTLEEALQVMDSINLGEITSVCFFFFLSIQYKDNINSCNASWNFNRQIVGSFAGLMHFVR